jgi:hypothetical protein
MQPQIENVRLSRALPLHELNARRTREQVLTRPPALQTAPPPPPPPVLLIRQPVRIPCWAVAPA